MPLATGTRLGPYEIVSPLGAGGMGEVYRARDTKLHRDIAIKVLPQPVARDPDHLARFKREAQVLASLNHPHIAQIYGVEESDDVLALVMELVEGPTLADRIAHGPVPIDEALPIARQIAEALEAAHESGIIHRDLKPANVKVRPDGTVKVLDFGLAKAFEPVSSSSPALSQSPTLSLHATYAGVILGTAAYMAPEQASGRPVDKRVDIWSFGVVLWEMLTGLRLFDGETISHTLAAVLRAEINFEQLPSATPVAVRFLIRRCLDRDVKRRLRDIGEARVAIDRAADPSEIASPNNSRVARTAVWVTAAAVFAIVTAFVSYLAWRKVAVDHPVLQLSAPFPDKARIDPGSLPAVSPDGHHIAFAVTVDGQRSLWVRDLNSIAPRRLAAGGIFPFWSPDSRAIAFFADGKLKRVDVGGGSALTICDAPNGRGGSWNKNDVILFAPTIFSGLWRVPAGGGSPAQVTMPDAAHSETDHRNPQFLPDGHHFLYTRRNADPEKTAAYIGDLESPLHQFLPGVKSNVAYTSWGYLIFMREQTLMAEAFDPVSLETKGPAMPVAEQVDYFPGEAQGQFSTSQTTDRDAVLAYTAGWVEGATQLTWFDRTGKPLGTVGAPGAILQNPAISPDGNAIAFTRFDAQTGGYDVWIHDLIRHIDSRFTSNPKGRYRFPTWSPDSASLAFAWNRDGVPNVFQKSVAGIAAEMILDESTRTTWPTDWSRDNRYIIEGVLDPKTKTDIWVLPLFGDRKPRPYLQSGFNESDARVSPDGRWLAYVSDESRSSEVFVQTFPAPGRKVQISNEGGEHPVWSRDGRELFFIGGGHRLMVVGVNDATTFDATVPKALFDTRDVAFDVSKDGRFLRANETERSVAQPMSVVVNWPALLKR